MIGLRCMVSLKLQTWKIGQNITILVSIVLDLDTTTTNINLLQWLG